MIKVLLVVLNNVLNGTERYVVDLARKLPKDEFDVHVAVPVTGPLSKILADNNIKELVYDNGKVNYYSFKGLRNLYGIIKKNKFDVVHANAKFHPCLLGRLAGVKLNVETKHGIFYSKKQLESLPFARRKYEYIKQFFVDKFIAISENDKNTLIKYFKIKEKKISVIYLGVDAKDIRSKCKKPDRLNNGREFVIGHIGRMTFQKAQEYLIEAFSIVTKKFPEARLLIAGKGEDEDKIRKITSELGLDDKVTFEGYINDVYSKIAGFDALVLTSRFEGTPYVNFEAMALGVPVITTDVGGMTNIFTNGTDALITEVENPQSTADAIIKLISEPQLRQTLSENALRLLDSYTLEKLAEQTAEFYRQNLKR